MAEQHEYWRIIRFTDMPGKALARLDKRRNVLEVDRAIFDCLAPHEQSRVLSTDINLDFGGGVRTHTAAAE